MLSTSFQNVIVLTSLLRGIFAFDPYNDPDGEGCVDPSGFKQCFKTSENSFVECGNYCKKQTVRTYEDCIVGCSRTRLSTNMGCWIQSCWNQVYSCEYQLTAIQYIQNWDLVQGHPDNVVPFYPAPEGASGACSCNLGYVYGNSSYVDFNNACIDAALTADQDILDNCQCCQFSYKLSNIITACPNSDLTKLAQMSTQISNTQALLRRSKDQCAVLDTNPALCIDQYKFPYANNTIHNPFNLPPAGKEPVSNLPGNAFTEGGDPFTMVLKGYTTTITLAPFDKNAGAVTTGLKGDVGAIASVQPTETGSVAPTPTGEGGSVSSSGSGTETGSAAATSTTGAASRLGHANVGMLGAVVGLLLIV